MAKYCVYMNGSVCYARFDNRKQADDYVRMQQNSVKGGGVVADINKLNAEKKSFAARQSWEIKVES